VLASCTAAGNQLSGIESGGASVVFQCTTADNMLAGIYASGIGNRAGTVVAGCVVRGNMSRGILAQKAWLLRDNVVTGNGLAGIEVNGEFGLISSNEISENTNPVQSKGITAGARCRIENNTIRAHDIGIRFAADYTFAMRNFVTPTPGGVSFENLTGPNFIGVFVNAPATPGAIAGDSGGSGLGTTNYWDNITY
jgi:hypothetical protein